MVFWAAAGLLVLTFWVALVGAPYVPTRAADARRILRAAGIKKSDYIVDLGSGDGRVLLAAARQGVASTGFELSVPLYFISRLRLMPYRRLARVRLANYWHSQLPDDTTVVFTFLAGKYMVKMDAYLQREANRLGRSLTFISYAFELPDRTPIKKDGALIIYRISPGRA